MTGMEIYALYKLAEMGTKAVSSVIKGVRKKKEAKEFEASEDYQMATEAGGDALGRITGKDGYTVQESVVDAEADRLLGATSKVAEQEKADYIFGPSTTQDIDRKNQLAEVVSSNRLQAMQGGRDNVLKDLWAKQARDKDIFQIGESYKGQLAQIQGEGREAMESGLGTLGAGAAMIGGKKVVDQYKADRDDSTMGDYNPATDDELAKIGSTDLMAGVDKKALSSRLTSTPMFGAP